MMTLPPTLSYVGAVVLLLLASLCVFATAYLINAFDANGKYFDIAKRIVVAALLVLVFVIPIYGTIKFIL